MASLVSIGSQESRGSGGSSPRRRTASKRGLPSSSSSSSKYAPPAVSQAAKNEGEMLVYIADLSTELLGKKRPLVLRSYSTVKEVKGVLKRRLHLPVAQQRLFFRAQGQLKELKNKHSLQDCGVCRSGETIFFALRGGREGSVALEPVHGGGRCPRELRHCLLQSKRALMMGKVPALSLEGTGGCYFLPDPRGDAACVFKPRDEELFMVNNPRGAAFSGGGAPDGHAADGLLMRHGIAPGSSCYREVAAYVLDTGSRAGVPESHLVESAHPKFSYHDRRPVAKLGSLSVFIPNIGVAEDYSFSRFPVGEVHKIALFDLRILNCDRNAANLLVRQPVPGGDLVLVPIDHGFCLPAVLEIGWCDWCWLDWPQLKEPLDAAAAEYVLSEVDPARDAELLRERFSLPEQCLCLLKLSGMLLQKGVRAGLNLFEIASLVVRQDVANDEHSELERVHHRANEVAGAAVKAGAFREACDCSPPPRRRPPPVAVAAAAAAAENPRGVVADLSLDIPPPPLWPEGNGGKRRRGEEDSFGRVAAAEGEQQPDDDGEEEEEGRADDPESSGGNSGRASPPGFWVEDPSLSASKADAASLRADFHDDTHWNDDDDSSGAEEGEGGGGGGCNGDDASNNLAQSSGAFLSSTPSSVAISPLGDDVEEMLACRKQDFMGVAKCQPRLSSGQHRPIASTVMNKEEFHARFWEVVDDLLSDLVQRQLEQRASEHAA